MHIILTIKSKKSFVENEVPAMGPGKAPKGALNGAQ